MQIDAMIYPDLITNCEADDLLKVGTQQQEKSTPFTF